MIKVEIGPGPNKIDPSWLTVGPYESPQVDYVCKWGTDPLPFEDNSIDLVYSSHCLEHIIWYDTVKALEDVHRVLKLGATLEIHVPNFEVIVEAYLTRRPGDSWYKYNEDKDCMTWVNGRIFTYGGPGNIHRAVFDTQHLHNCLSKAGFTQIVKGATVRGHDHGRINLGMTAIKGQK